VSRRVTFSLILAVAFLIRCWAVHYHAAPPSSDAAEYNLLAQSIASGHGFSENGHATSYRPPLYPAFIACVYKVTGTTDWKLAEYANVFLGVVTVWLIFVLARQRFGDRVALAAAAIAAVFPSFIWISRILLSENLVLPLILATLLTFPRWWCGGLLGLTLLCRPSTIFLAAVLFVTLAIGKEWRKLFRIGLLALAVMAPWTLRNYAVHHAFVPVATDGGATLYISYWPDTKNGKAIWGNNVDLNFTGSEVESSRAYVRQVEKRLHSDPLRPIKLVPVKLFWLLAPVEWEYFPNPRSINWGYVLIAIPALLAAVRSRDAVLWSVPIALLLQTVIFYGGARHRLPAEPILVIWAAVTLTTTFAALQSRQLERSRTAIPTG